jgi:hypothetical protein
MCSEYLSYTESDWRDSSTSKILGRKIAVTTDGSSFVRLIAPGTSYASTVEANSRRHSVDFSGVLKIHPKLLLHRVLLQLINCHYFSKCFLWKNSPTQSRKSHRVLFKNIKPFGGTSISKMLGCKIPSKQLLTVKK